MYLNKSVCQIMDDDGSYTDMQQCTLNSKLEASTKELKQGFNFP